MRRSEGIHGPEWGMMMGVKFEPLFRWTSGEDDLIRKRYPDGGIEACINGLRRFKRSGGAIYARARKLGLTEKRSRDAILEECALIADEMHRQDENNNGAAMTGAAGRVAEAIRSLIASSRS